MQLAPAPWALALLLPVAPCPSLPAQGEAPLDTESPEAVEARRAEAVALALRLWVAAFEAGDLQPTGRARGRGGEYLEVAVRGGLFFKAGLDRPNLTHIAMLQRLIGLAELHQTSDCADALLWLSACGNSQDLYTGKVMMIRELGRFALLRMKKPMAWARVMEVVAQKPVEKEDPDAGEETVEVFFQGESWQGPPKGQVRQAAIHLLGMQRKAVFRPRLEGCLEDPDSRVRLAAAEALMSLHHESSLPALQAAMQKERHEVVSQALINAAGKVLDKHMGSLRKEQWQGTSRAALSMLGRCGWRNDLSVVNLLKYFPVREAVPALIELMGRSKTGLNPILKIVNKNASRRLHDEIHACLRKITGALVEADAAAWKAFWEQEKDKITLKPADHRARDKSRTYVPSSSGTFYGIPVTGTEVVFVLDTSGSMKHKLSKESARALRDSGTVGKYQQISTRLDAARFQTLNAVHGMDPHTSYHIVTFASGVRAWNRKPVKPNKNSHRALTDIMRRLKPAGGTNVFDTLLYVLKANELNYGQKIKNKVDEVFLLTDGMPSAGPVTDEETIRQMVRDANKYQKIRINTVFSGAPDSAGAKFLKALAEENHGVFVQT